MDDTRDKLFILKQGFQSPNYPGRRFFCSHCALFEGLITAFPNLTRRLAVEKIEWQRPRMDIIAIVGEQNQSVPLLVLPKGETSAHQQGIYEGRAFISDKDKIIAALVERHDFPELFPG